MKNQRILTSVELLDAVPVRNGAVRAEPTDDGELILHVPLRRRWFMRPPVSWLLPLRAERRFGLDRLGAEVWRACDGVRTTEQIIEQFASVHRLRFHEARLCVTAFLRELTQRGLIVMVGQSSSEASR